MRDEISPVAARVLRRLAWLSVVSISILGFTSACASSDPVEVTRSGRTTADSGTRSGSRGELVAALDDARSRWQARATTDYEWHVQRSCYCLADPWDNVVATVIDGEVVRLLGAEPNDEPEQLLDLDSVQRWHTVDGYLDELSETLERDPDRVVWEFDADYGFPTQVTFDFVSRVSDDETYFDVLWFRPLSALTTADGAAPATDAGAAANGLR